MPAAVLDPGVLVAALISPGGAPARLLLAWFEGYFELVVSPRLLEELERVLRRTKFRRYVTAAEVTEYVELLARRAVVVHDPAAAPPVTPDPGDDYLVALARAARADVLVSGDIHLTGLEDPEPPVLTPRRFLDQLGAGRWE
ncbi:MAG TPA: putative toxin-antitoxin system toxin component, PIN family [Actinomycetota bacterium]|nr:putative toxin-antitoxin system toxin component, PIN family [Actinomycetota bacterium]